jgi:hypothetical protein
MSSVTKPADKFIDRDTVLRTCPQCGDEYPVSLRGPGRPPIYCSGRCRMRALRVRTAPTRDELVDKVLAGLRMATMNAAALRRVDLRTLELDVLAGLARHLEAANEVLEPVAIFADPEPDSVTPPVETRSPEPAAEQPKATTASPAAKSARTLGGLRPTGEQDAIIDAYETGENLVVNAGAGTGKTETLRLSALTSPDRRALYVGFNKAIVTEAKRKFPSHVTCSTAHSLAYRALGYAYKGRLNGPRVPAKDAAKVLGITKPVQIASGGVSRTLDPAALARLASDAVGRFCHSADRELGLHHVPSVNGVDGVPMTHLRTLVLPLAEAAWAELQKTSGRLRFTHDHYLKMWSMTDPDLGADVVFFDEAQDANPVIAAVVQAQKGQLVAVGDENQAIYGWRGAIDALRTWPARHRLHLTQSWRFGPAIAAEANKWLSALDADLRLTGTSSISSRLEALDRPDAVLCRTNGEAMSQAMAAMDKGLRVALVGGGTTIKKMAEAARDLQAGRHTDHPELLAFATWAEVQDYVESEEDGARDLKVFVRLVDDHGPAALIAAANALTQEDRADLVVSTAHKAKGREWKRVKIGSDFRPPAADEDGNRGRLSRSEAMLAYVSVTRAQHVLDNGALAWIDDWMAGKATPATRRGNSSLAHSLGYVGDWRD